MTVCRVIAVLLLPCCGQLDTGIGKFAFSRGSIEIKKPEMIINWGSHPSHKRLATIPISEPRCLIATIPMSAFSRATPRFGRKSEPPPRIRCGFNSEKLSLPSANTYVLLLHWVNRKRTKKQPVRYSYGMFPGRAQGGRCCCNAAAVLHHITVLE